MTERKIFNVAKAVPVVGQAYGIVRGIVYAAKGDSNEAKYSVTMDLADLNPLRMPKNLAHGIAGIRHDLNTGVWIGRRPLFNQTVALNITPGVDGYHWCIQINGFIYELSANTDNSNITIHINSENRNHEAYERKCKRFSWYFIQRELPDFDPQVLESFAKSYEEREYRMFIPTGGKLNCQSFVTRMFAAAANISMEKARSIIILVVPNLLF